MTTVVQPSPAGFGSSHGHVPTHSHSQYPQQQQLQNSQQSQPAKHPRPPLPQPPQPPQHAQSPSQPPHPYGSQHGTQQFVPYTTPQTSASNLATITESAPPSAGTTPRTAAQASFPDLTPAPSHAPSAAASTEELAALEFAHETGTPATGLYSQNGLWSDDSDEEEQRMSWRQRLSNSTAGDRRSVKSSKSNGGHSHRGSRSKMDSIISPLSVESPWPWSRKSVAERRESPPANEQQEVLAGDNPVRGGSGNRHSGRMSPSTSISSCPQPHPGKHQHTASMHSISSQHSTVSAASVASNDLSLKQRISMGRLRRKSTSKGGFNDFPDVVPAVPQIPAALESTLSIRSQKTNSRGSLPGTAGDGKKDLKASASTKADHVNVSVIPTSSSSSSLKALAAEARVHAASPSAHSPRPSASSITTPRQQPQPLPSPSPTPTRTMPQPVPMPTPTPTQAVPVPRVPPQAQAPASNRLSITTQPKKEEKDRPKSFIKRNVERLWRSKSAHGLHENYDGLEPSSPPPVPELPSKLRKPPTSTSQQAAGGRATPANPAATLGRISSPVANPIAASAIFPMAPGTTGAAPMSPVATGHSTNSAQTGNFATISGLPSSGPAGDELAAHLAALDAKYPSFSASTLGGAAGKSTRSFNLIDPDEALETDPFASAFEPPRRPLSRVMSRTSTRTSARDSTRDSMLTLDEDVPRPWTPGLNSPSMRSLMPRLYKSKSFASSSRPSSMAMFFSKDKDRDSKPPPTPDLPTHTIVNSPVPTVPSAASDVPSPRPTPSRSPLHITDTEVEEKANAAEETPVFYDSFDVPPSEDEEPRSRCGSVTRGEIAKVSRAFPAPPTTFVDELERLEPASQQQQQPATAVQGSEQEAQAIEQSRIVGPPRGSSSGSVSGVTGGVIDGGVGGSPRQDHVPFPGPSLNRDRDVIHHHHHRISSHRHSNNSSDDDIDNDLAPRHSASVSGSSLELRTPHPNTHPDSFAAHPILKDRDHPDSRDHHQDDIPPRPESANSFQQLYDQLDINPNTLQPIHPLGPAADDASFCDPFGLSHPGSAFSYKAPQVASTSQQSPGRAVPAVPFPEVENSPRLHSSEDYAFPIDIPSQPSSCTACDPDLATTPNKLKRMAVDYSLQRKGFNPHAAAEPEPSHGLGVQLPQRSSSRREPHRHTSEGRHEHREAYQRLGSGMPSPGAGASRSRRESNEPRQRVRSGPEQWIDDMDTSSSENEQDETPLSQLHPAAAQQQQERRARSLARREARRAERERQLRCHKQNQHSDGTLRPAAHWNGEGGVPADVLAGRLENVAISNANGGLAAPLRSQRSLRRPHRSSDQSPSPALSRATTMSSRPSRPSSARPLPNPSDHGNHASSSHSQAPAQGQSRPASGASAAQHRSRQRSHSIGARHPPPSGDVPPLPRGRALPVRCIVVADEIRQISIDVYHDTIAREILSQLKGKLPAPTANAAWVVCEVFTERGLERQVRDYENIASLVKGWDASAANCLAIRESALTLARQVPESAPFVGGWCQLEVKPGKWSKRWLETRGGQVFLSKNDKGKDEVQLNTLFSDVYRPQQSYGAPQPFVFAIKRLEPSASFERPDEFLFTIASDESTGYKLHTAVYSSRSFTIGTGNPAAMAPKTKSLGRSKSMAQRRPEQTLLDVHNTPSAFTGKGLLKHGH
ncbi:hypothetical protein A1Q2_08363 [Trichosporon asahii var. asahii CBS 8904]|uniref:PH domain-containing protein n=1 Tax=Trichosporon asahii var. asahii (strain CBS 8904) TaxID=1220162 RepID=K1VE55_TRIAC|nr:hypothetical protein A1Q2_08363 [Trichosporon asahii var. asahii CBS 8904]